MVETWHPFLQILEMTVIQNGHQGPVHLNWNFEYSQAFQYLVQPDLVSVKSNLA